MLRRRLAGIGLAVDGFQPHCPHQSLYPLAVDLMSLGPEPSRHPARATIKRLQILPVHPGHQVQIRRVSRCRPVVHCGTAELQQTTLLYYRKPGVSSVHHSQSTAPTHSPDLRDKKSRSTLSCPICWYRYAVSASCSLSAFAVSLPKTSNAP